MSLQDRFDQAVLNTYSEREKVDCQKVIRVAQRRLGIILSFEQARLVWQVMENECIGEDCWLEIDTEDEIIKAIEIFMQMFGGGKINELASRG